jgi:hypothetical protein
MENEWAASLAAAGRFQEFSDEELDEISEDLIVGKMTSYHAQRMTTQEILLAASLGLQVIIKQRKRLTETSDGDVHRQRGLPGESTSLLESGSSRLQ